MTKIFWDTFITYHQTKNTVTTVYPFVINYPLTTLPTFNPPGHNPQNPDQTFAPDPFSAAPFGRSRCRIHKWSGAADIPLKNPWPQNHPVLAPENNAPDAEREPNLDLILSALGRFHKDILFCFCPEHHDTKIRKKVLKSKFENYQKIAYNPRNRIWKPDVFSISERFLWWDYNWPDMCQMTTVTSWTRNLREIFWAE